MVTAECGESGKTTQDREHQARKFSANFCTEGINMHFHELKQSRTSTPQRQSRQQWQAFLHACKNVGIFFLLLHYVLQVFVLLVFMTLDTRLVALANIAIFVGTRGFIVSFPIRNEGRTFQQIHADKCGHSWCGVGTYRAVFTRVQDAPFWLKSLQLTKGRVKNVGTKLPLFLWNLDTRKSG